MNRNSLFNCAALFAVVMFAASMASAQTAPAVYASPADVVAACRAAHARGDIAAELDCYGPTGQDALVKVLMTMIAATPTTLPAGQAANPEKAAFDAKYHLDQRQQRPGESREDFAARLASQLPGKRAFLLDFMTQQRAFMARQRAAASTQPASTQPASQLEDVQVDPSGASATGKVTRTDPDGGKWSQTVKFEKVGDSWRIASIMMY